MISNQVQKAAESMVSLRTPLGRLGRRSEMLRGLRTPRGNRASRSRRLDLRDTSRSLQLTFSSPPCRKQSTTKGLSPVCAESRINVSDPAYHSNAQTRVSWCPSRARSRPHHLKDSTTLATGIVANYLHCHSGFHSEIPLLVHHNPSSFADSVICDCFSAFTVTPLFD